MPQQCSRRVFVGSMLGTSAALLATGNTLGAADEADVDAPLNSAHPRILKSLKWGMIQVEGSVMDRFRAAKQAGFHGLELDSPGGPPADEVRAAVKETGVIVDGTVDSTHWKIRLSDANAEIRQRGGNDLIQAIEDTATWGGHSVLLVPGHGQDGTPEETWERSAEQVQRALPTAARLGIYILMENVWNHMFYDHGGSADQTADQLADYVDQFDSPWIGVQFDIGNHQKYGSPAAWIRTLGKRIVKLDVKDWGANNGFCKIGDGDVDWAKVRAALHEIGFTGWAAAEVAGGGADRLAEISHRMDRALAAR